MRDWRGTKAAIGDRVFYVSADATCEPAIHEAWAEEVDQTRILARTAASPSGDVTGNGEGTRRLHQPENFVVVKGAGLRMTGGVSTAPVLEHYDRRPSAQPQDPPPSAMARSASRSPGSDHLL